MAEQNFPKGLIKIDAGIRDSSKKGIKQPIYLHRDCKPIDDVYLKENQGELFDEACGGYYHVYCVQREGWKRAVWIGEDKIIGKIK